MLNDPALGKRLALKYIGTVGLGGGGSEDSKQGDVAKGVTVSFPGITFPSENVIVFHKADSLFSDLLVEGIIGGTLTQSLVEIDYAQSRIRFHDRGTYNIAPGFTEHPISFSRGVPVIDADLDLEGGAHVPIKLLVDTGAQSFPIMIFTWPEPRIQMPEKTVEFTGRGLSGDFAAQFGRVPSLQIGKYVLQNVIAAFADSSAVGHVALLGQNGILGHEIIRRFSVVLDYAGSRIFLKPNQGFSDAFDADMTGIMAKTTKSGYYKVYRIREGTPATESDIQPGDLIVAIAGKDARSLSFKDFSDACTRDGSSLTITIKRESGQLQRTLTLKRQI